MIISVNLAMTSDRSYRKAPPVNEAMAEIGEGIGGHINPEAAATFR
jgi:HD-GYP domain-containing protein (c-di-GMP phosphodiesterase class II)